MIDMKVDKGHFVRSETKHRHELGTEKYPAEGNGRYLLYIANACPWANRISLVIHLLGLEEHIPIVSVAAEFEKTKLDDPSDIHTGWVFAKEKGETFIGPDPIFGARTLRDVYESVGDKVGRFTTPVLFDTKTKTFVNNESAELLRMIPVAFKDLCKNPMDLYPESLRPRIDELNEDIYHNVNNGVYKCGFAQSQEAYDTNVPKLFDALERLESILDKSRYVCGDQVTETDLRLFTTLVRFDAVYHTHFKCNIKKLSEFPNLYNYVKEIYQLPGVAKTVNLREIMDHYYKSHLSINPFKIVPKGPEPLFHTSHDRDQKFPKGKRVKM